MLDVDTKRRIDTARDILVGKVPDPKSQVEQITIALIYKFMDDLDAESEELGGGRKFFSGDFARYGWAKLMHSGLGGYETLNLYAEAITRMPENPGIPPLFRDIFNNAYLPYRDPETLRSFLKVIDGFTYDHSERLGDAFEYLLSVLGAQGDAGQFRTPRHIIDFIVAIVDPKKDDIVLDPACGTAGFLISAYKHILAANTDGDGQSTLTPDDRGRLVDNFKGYDISPDMVRLSLVNMYLHGFREPHIYEYDTLTSEERWNEYADIILANPPFMSPRGGIRPHNRFSVQSKRSEVLFVDYMAEHLTATGRVGVIVPEGIIFQSQTAYKQLRKMLVEEYLVAVVSLPTGVFNPYSGVKTSILILDRALAKRTDTIAFFKVDNDGFDLGAQRRPINRNDLPRVEAELVDYLGRVRAGESLDDFETVHGQVVGKDKIATDGDFDLNGERFRESQAARSNWPMASLGDVVEILDSMRRPITKHDRESGPYPYYGATGILDYIDGYLFDEPLVLVGEDGAKWGCGNHSAFAVNGKVWVNNHAHVLRSKHDQLLDRYLIETLNQMDLTPYITGVTVPKLNQAKLKSIKIPLPPIEVQRDIVAEIEGYQRVIDGARAVVENYRSRIAVDPEWPMVELGDVCERIQYGLSDPLNNKKTGYKTFRMNELIEGQSVDRGDMKCADISAEQFEKYRLARGDILFNRTNSIEHVGRTGIFDLDGDYCFASYLIRLSIANEAANPFYVNAFMNTESFQTGIKQYASRAIGQSNINAKSLGAYRIPLPSVSVQDSVVAELDAEKTLVKANRELIQRFEGKIQSAVGRVWGEGASALTDA